MATAVLAVELLALGTAGCWDRTEINDVAMVEGVGFDAAPNGGVTLTASIVLPSGIPGIGGTAGGGGAGTGPTSTVVSASGATIGAAQSQLQESVPAIIFWGQTRVVVIGQALARRGIAEEVGFFLRERIARPRASFFVTQGEAGKILQGSSPFRSIASANIIENAMLRLQPSMAAYRVGQLLMQPGASFLLPEVELQQSNPPGPVPQSGGGGGGRASG